VVANKGTVFLHDLPKQFDTFSHQVGTLNEILIALEFIVNFSSF
jgi:hypothetical protein